MGRYRETGSGFCYLVAMVRTHPFVLIVGLLFAACAGSGSGYAALLVDFDELEVGAVPAGWSVAETSTAGTPAAWRVEAGADGRFVRLAETVNSGQTFNILFAPEDHSADVAVSVRLRADAGTEDQGGGVVWRAQDRDNYYVARWNPLENNLRAYKVIGGVREQLASADLKLALGWHSLEASMRGRHIVVSMNGEPLLDFEDESITSDGMVGLWTKADAATSFDEFRIVSLD